VNEFKILELTKTGKCIGSLLSLLLLDYSTYKDATKRPYPPKQQVTAQARRQWSVNSRFWFSLAVESAKQTVCLRRRQSPVGRID